MRVHGLLQRVCGDSDTFCDLLCRQMSLLVNNIPVPIEDDAMAQRFAQGYERSVSDEHELAVRLAVHPLPPDTSGPDADPEEREGVSLP